MHQDKKEKRSRRALRDALSVSLMTTVILLSFACFHHVLPFIQSQREMAQLQKELTAATPSPAPTATPMAETPESPQPTETPTGSEWQQKFAEHFTDEVVVSENGYSSPNLSVTITEYNDDFGDGPLRWYVCDVYIAGIDNLGSAFAYNTFRKNYAQDILEMMEYHNAVFAISGDSCLRQAQCLSVRNAQLFDSRPKAAEVYVMYRDGSMEVLETAGLDVEALLAETGDRQVYQCFHFGPSLLNEDGSARTDFGTALDKNVLMDALHPRAGIGYYEPGHYCMIVADGRQIDSKGATMSQFAGLFELAGCKSAYNLDGGKTAQIALNGEKYNIQSNGNYHPQNDIIYLTDVAPGAGEGQ